MRSKLKSIVNKAIEHFKAESKDTGEVATDLVFLDARTTDHMRMTSFGFSVVDVLKDYREWVEEYSLQQSNIAYADVFSMSTEPPSRIARCEINPNGDVELLQAPADVDPYHRGRKKVRWPWKKKNS